MRTHHIVACIASVVFLTGCPFNRHVDYRGTSTFATPATSVTMLGAQDQRPYITNQNKPEDFVGVIRTTNGKPYDVHSSSGEPLADDLGGLVAGAFRNNGTNMTQVKIPSTASANERHALFNSTYYLIDIREWQTDTPVHTSFLTYDVSLSIIDANGSVLATKSASGKDVLDSGSEDKNLSATISRIFGGLINDSAIASVAGRNATPLPVQPSSLLLPTSSTESVAAPSAPAQQSVSAPQPEKTENEGGNYREFRLKSSGR